VRYDWVRFGVVLVRFWYGLVLFDIVWCGLVWFGVIGLGFNVFWCGLVYFGVIWYVWCSLVWFWYGLTQSYSV
jgi:hypothetical protein